MVARKEIVKKSFDPDGFRAYVAGLNFSAWTPEFIVLHNTQIPSLAQRPDGLTRKHIDGLLEYYWGEKHWSAGPHLFVDDRQIWVFTALTTPGVHSPSWNEIALGVEMLGDFDREEFDSGRGLQVQELAVQAIAILSEALDLDPGSMRLHREDPETDHHCPGDKVDKAEFIDKVRAAMGAPARPAEVQIEVEVQAPEPEKEEEAPEEAPAELVVVSPEEIPLARERLEIFRAAAENMNFPEEVGEALAEDLGPGWLIWILMAIDSRESRFGLLLDEDGLGDHGHGHGELQIDDRFHGAFLATGKWRDLGESLAYAYESVLKPFFNLLADNFELFHEDYGELFWGTISAYNAGAGGVLKALEAGQTADYATTGHDYAQDVKARALELMDALGV